MTEAAATSHEPHAETLAILARVFGEGAFLSSMFRDNLRVFVPADRLIEVLATLKSEGGFGALADLGCVDYLGYPDRVVGKPRFEVHYALLNPESHERIVVKVGVDDPQPTIPSAVPLWLGAGWMEREIFDMFGITFAGTPTSAGSSCPRNSPPTRSGRIIRSEGEANDTTSPD